MNEHLVSTPSPVSHPPVAPAAAASDLATLALYKSWANVSVFATVLALPNSVVVEERPTRWQSIVHTLNHVHVIDEIFRAHLLGEPHGYRERNTEVPPPLQDLWKAVQQTDRWYAEYACGLTAREATEAVDFQFVSGEAGRMTRGEILLHVVNHGTYHRGLVSDMLYQAGVELPANDLTVFLRDHRARP